MIVLGLTVLIATGSSWYAAAANVSTLPPGTSFTITKSSPSSTTSNLRRTSMVLGNGWLCPAWITRNSGDPYSAAAPSRLRSKR